MEIINLNEDVPKILTSGKVEIDLEKQTVKVDGKIVNLSKEEYDIVVLMVRHHLL